MTGYFTHRRNLLVPRAALLLTVALLLGATNSNNHCSAFTPPSLGLGALLFPVRSLRIERISEQNDHRLVLRDASDFFVQAFWTSKVGGGARQLSARQTSELQQAQYAEFNKRYGSNSRNSNTAELVIARTAGQEIVACAGVQVERIPNGSLKNRVSEKQAPLMSNLAVSRNYRRRGLAEQLVKAVEDLARNEWEYDECYLYVEERNRAALNLYQKLGYRKIWRDNDARTLMPTTDGGLMPTATVIVCMEKKLKKSGWFNLF